MTKIEYALGHHPGELRRLELQAALGKPATARVLGECGLRAGMRVSDIGTGAGDLAILAAEFVGPAGPVVGIDRSAEVIQHTNNRAGVAALPQLSFRVASFEELSEFGSFDLVIGRYVLFHRADRVAFLRRAASFARPGGCIAFIEPACNVGMQMSVPKVALYEESFALLIKAALSDDKCPDLGRHLAELFRKAGLDEPTLAHDVPTGGSNSRMAEWMSLTVRSVLPHLEKVGVTTAAAVQIDTLQERLQKAASAASSQLSGLSSVSAWVRVPAG
jgi:ubiquinone/menaquinone biosynthesis C-methylase UbiE